MITPTDKLVQALRTGLEMTQELLAIKREALGDDYRLTRDYWEAEREIQAALAEHEAQAQAVPACWTLTETLDAGETTCSGRLWFTDPKNSAWEPLYRGAVLAEAPQPEAVREEPEEDPPAREASDWAPPKGYDGDGSVDAMARRALAAKQAAPQPEAAQDDWRKYATEREHTAQQVIERHRAEHESLLRLLAKDRGTIAELQAALAAQQAEREPQWRPIETAPKDGSSHLLADAVRGIVAPCIRGVIHDNHGAKWEYGEEGTHWMPLPPPPERAHSIGKEGA